MYDFKYEDSKLVGYPSVRLIAQKDFEHLILISNAGIVYNEGYVYGITAGYIAGNFTPWMEYFRDFDETKYGYVGTAYCIKNNLSIDGGVYFTLNNECKFSRVEIGFSWYLTHKK